jgi:hypothetical protein
MGKIQVLWSRTLPSPSSVSKARNRSPDHWVFWDSRVCKHTVPVAVRCFTIAHIRSK